MVQRQHPRDPDQESAFCTKCEQVKPAAEFYVSEKAGYGPRLSSWCKLCFRATNRRYMRRHRTDRKAATREGKARDADGEFDALCAEMDRRYKEEPKFRTWCFLRFGRPRRKTYVHPDEDPEHAIQRAFDAPEPAP